MNPTESASWEALSHSWRAESSKETIDLHELEHRVLKDKHSVRLRLVLELAIAGSGIAIGVWLVQGSRDARFGFGTIAFVLLVLALALHARRGEGVRYETDSVTQMLRSTLAHAHRELTYTRAGYFACLAGVLFTAFISLSSGTQPSGERQRPRVVAAMFFGLAWSGAFAIGLRRRERTLKSEIDRLEFMQSTLC